MKLHKLGDIFRISSGGTPSRKIKDYYDNGTIPWVKTGNLKSKYVEEPLERITEVGLRNSSAKLFPSKTVLIAMYGATIGSCSILQFEASTNQACAAFLPNRKVNEGYLYYYLRSIHRQLVLRGQGGGQPNISATLLKEVKIPIPDDFDDQIRIAKLLSHVEGLIATRKDNLCLLDEFLKSTFLEMFGDPVRNENGWDHDRLENIVAEDCPLTYGIVQPGQEYPDGVSIVRPVDLITDIISIESLKKIDPKIDTKFKRTKLRGGELLMCVRGTTGVISIAGKALKGANVTRGITPMWFDTTYNSMFALHQLKSEPMQRKIQEKTYGAALKQINLKDVRTLQLIRPPLDIQKQFAAISKKVGYLKTHYQQNLNELENLYGVLSQKAFKGELDLSRIPLEGVPKETVSDTTTRPTDQSAKLDGYAMSDPAEREQLLRQLFDAFITERKGESFSLDGFWLQAEERVMDHMDDEDSPLGVADYDKAKEWLFELIKSGNIRQLFYEEKNYMGLSIKT